MEFIPLAKPDINKADVQAAAKVMLSGMLIQGKNVLKLEKNVSSFLKCKHAAAVSNGTASLHLSLLALGIGKDDEVIVPSFSFIATANVVELIGAKPVFVDIDSDTFNMDASKIEAAVTGKTKAIIAVHEFGLACDIEKIISIAKAHQLFVIEDAACAFGAMQNGNYTGTFGHIGSFSFHPRKAITSGEGGMVTTNDASLSRRIRILRNHGNEIENGKSEFVTAGFNYRMTDFQAALLNSQLGRAKKIIRQKQKLAKIYFEKIRNPKIKLPVIPPGRNHTWQSFHIVFDSSVNRDEVILQLKRKKIGTNYGAQCIPAQKYFLEKYQLDCERLFPNAMTAYKQGLAIPMHTHLAVNDISYIAQQLNGI